MIGRLSGVLIEKNPPTLLVDVAGVGYEVDVPMSTFYHLPQTGAKIELHTHLQIREDAHVLFGFSSLKERSAFRELIKVSGIGTRTALAVLSGLSVDELAHAIVQQQSEHLVKIPGIGKKTADRLLLELRGKFAASSLDQSSSATRGANLRNNDAIHALIALGYHEKEADKAIKTLPEGLTVEEAIRQALRQLSKL